MRLYGSDVNAQEIRELLAALFAAPAARGGPTEQDFLTNLIRKIDRSFR